MMTEYRKLMDYLSLSPGDLADVMTAYLLVSIETVRGETPNAEERRAVRGEVAAKLTESSELRRLGASDKQILAERYAYSTLATAVTFQLFKRGDEAVRLAGFRSRVRDNVLKATGIDPGRVAFTEMGLSRRR
ncbi:MAG: hypothetical protein QM690_21105 [Sphingobium sp.]